MRDAQGIGEAAKLLIRCTFLQTLSLGNGYWASDGTARRLLRCGRAVLILQSAQKVRHATCHLPSLGEDIEALGEDFGHGRHSA